MLPSQIKSVCVVAPHPDDESIGVGGTIARLVNSGIQVAVLIVGGHMPPLYSENDYAVTVDETKRCLTILGVKKFKFLGYPATKIHEAKIANLNEEMMNFLSQTSPDLVFIPFPDRHIDHRSVFESAMVVTRPNHDKAPRAVLAYETLSETHWNAPYIEPNFVPDFFFDISNHLQDKISALSEYKSQINHGTARSLKAVEALAAFRGSQNNCCYAEAFKLIRWLA